MALPLPNLDDRTYTDMVSEAQALIPSLDPTWTNHNPTDPGIVLVELLAWLTEMVLYRVNRVPDINYATFLKLLSNPADLTGNLDIDIRQTVLALRERYRAVTCDDFMLLATQAWPAAPAAKALGDAGLIKRAHCVAARNLALTDPDARTAPAPAHVSLVIVPAATLDIAQPQPTQALRDALWQFLDERRLLTTRHHIVGPDYAPVKITATLFLRTDARADVIRDQVVTTIRNFFHPLVGGPEQTGWPFGRAVYLSEVYALLEQVTGVDYVEDIKLITQDTWRNQLATDGSLSGITIQEHELVAVNVDMNSFVTQ